MNAPMGAWIKCFAEYQGSIYVATSDAGIYRLKKMNGFPYRFEFERIFTNELPKSITYLKVIDNRLWFAAGIGQYGFIKNNSVHVFKKAGYYFRNICAAQHEIWFGTKDNGILRISLAGDKIKNEVWLTDGSLLRSKNIYQLYTRKNEIWVGTEKGVDRIQIDSIGHPVSVDMFGYEDGLKGVETNVNAGFIDKQGDYWIGTINGLYQYKDRITSAAQSKPPILHLLDIQIVFKSIENTVYANLFNDGHLNGQLLLPYDQNHLGFIFKAIHYTQAKNIMYRWKLEGIDPDWSLPSGNGSALYPNLPPGKYKFHVKSSVNNSWNNTGQTVSFEIEKPYWQKLSFKITYYLLILVMLVVTVRLILRRQKRKAKAVEEKLRLEKEFLVLEQKALRLQMNPHFTFNVLNSIHNLIILNQPDKARYALSKFSKLMRQVLENSRHEFVSIDDELETVRNYVQLERITANLDIDFDVEIDPEIDTFEAILPPLLIQPFIENAIIHGFKNLDKKGRIKLMFELTENGMLVCQIEDNGIGRKAAAQLNAQKEVYHKSTALEVSQERLANLNGPSEGSFQIIDLYDEENKPVGTRIIFKLILP
jgi:two-component sensor histidine kinase